MIGIGAFIGDCSGSKYEFTPFIGKYEEIDVLGYGAHFTDDSVMTVAVMDWLISTNGEGDVAEFYRKYGRAYPNAGYGHLFYDWIFSDYAPAYGSYGNGSAMRVSPVGFYAKSVEECLTLAEKSAVVSHNHEEGVKGAMAIALAVYLAKKGKTRKMIKDDLNEVFDYNLSRSVDEIRGTHKFDATCQVTVPEALTCFFESKDFTDCVKKSIWIGGDVDTIAAMACPIAEAYYGSPNQYYGKIKKILPNEFWDVITRFDAVVSREQFIQ